MYEPDTHFMEKLKSLDPKLGCKYNNRTEKFNITFRHVTGEDIPLIQVSSEAGGYRQPDRRELLLLGESDMEKHSRRDHLNKASKYVRDYRIKQIRDASDNIRNMTKDNKYQLKNAARRLTGSGKANSMFRRINVKPKGKVFK